MDVRSLFFFVRYYFLIALWTGVSSPSYAQPETPSCDCSSFEILGELSESDAHHQALLLASLESYRYRLTDRILTFEDGTRFKLFSAKSMADCQCDLDMRSYPVQSDVDQAVTLIFKLFPNGKIGVSSTIDTNSKQARIGAGFPSNPIQVVPKSDFDRMPKSKQDIILSRPHQYKIE